MCIFLLWKYQLFFKIVYIFSLEIMSLSPHEKSHPCRPCCLIPFPSNTPQSCVHICHLSCPALAHPPHPPPPHPHPHTHTPHPHGRPPCLQAKAEAGAGLQPTPLNAADDRNPGAAGAAGTPSPSDFLERGQVVEVKFMAPKAGKHDVSIFAMPDCWLGCDRVAPLRLKVAEASRAQKEGREKRSMQRSGEWRGWVGGWGKNGGRGNAELCVSPRNHPSICAQVRS